MECQKFPACKVKKAPLISLPIMSSIFEGIVMDIVSPLPRSRSGERYILVLCDYVIRYPEAIPLHNTDTVHVAKELVGIFTGWVYQM